MEMKHKSLAAGALLLAISTSASAFTINLDYSYDTNNFFTGNATRLGLMNTAASFFESRITDTLTAIDSIGSNSFDAVFNNPGTGGVEIINDFDVAANTITVFVGARNLGGTLGVGGPGGFSVSGTSGFVNNAVQRGQVGAVRNPGATEFAPWGGAIAFNDNAAITWDFDSSDGTIGNDFYSVALHELGHVLGLGTADSWDNLVSGGMFTGANSVAAHGGNVPLHTDDAHWAEGTMSLVDGVTPQEAAMDPTLTQGTVKLFTDLDMAALDDIGWDVAAPIPLPPAVWLFGSGLLGLLGLRRRQKVHA